MWDDDVRAYREETKSRVLRQANVQMEEMRQWLLDQYLEPSRYYARALVNGRMESFDLTDEEEDYIQYFNIYMEYLNANAQEHRDTKEENVCVRAKILMDCMEVIRRARDVLEKRGSIPDGIDYSFSPYFYSSPSGERDMFLKFENILRDIIEDFAPYPYEARATPFTEWGETGDPYWVPIGYELGSMSNIATDWRPETDLPPPHPPDEGLPIPPPPNDDQWWYAREADPPVERAKASRRVLDDMKYPPPPMPPWGQWRPSYAQPPPAPPAPQPQGRMRLNIAPHNFVPGGGGLRIGPGNKRKKTKENVNKQKKYSLFSSSSDDEESQRRIPSPPYPLPNPDQPQLDPGPVRRYYNGRHITYYQPPPPLVPPPEIPAFMQQPLPRVPESSQNQTSTQAYTNTPGVFDITQRGNMPYLQPNAGPHHEDGPATFGAWRQKGSSPKTLWSKAPDNRSQNWEYWLSATKTNRSTLCSH